MNKLIVLLIALLSFNANACSPQDYWNCPAPPTIVYVPVPTTPVIVQQPFVPAPMPSTGTLVTR